ncbi:ABC transporter family substrate-binding protein [Quadrisphaera setariae]|uniref:ABC transporter family substrate-binding protein n=1 Tax=Quadrisphaera setariae TaxID=2593304 RepID=A0A5C8ZEL6_9ACTN|nr:ABC transporter family substrate-binding protein [Quadrisphaera setariae]TXR56495.1 ABC transporter family substrate-binding protein [Quadrisphaera setariae]
MITSRRATAALAVLAGGALLISGCSADRGGSTGGASSGSSSAGTSNATITVAHEQEFNSYNNNTADQNAVQNTVVLNNVLGGFWDFGPDGGVLDDKEFGTVEKTSDDPLTVKYTFNDKAVWSDGQALGCEDMVLAWAANSGKFTSQEKDENGNPLSGFSSAGTTGYEDMNIPQCKAGDKTVTVTYTKVFADWAGMFGAGSIMPAHIVAKNAGVSDLIGAITNNTSDQVAALAKFYNTGFIGKPGTVDKDNWPSSGPYMIDSWQAGQSITLKANPKWWGTPAKTGTIVIRFIDATAQAQALANGEIQVARPQPAQDILKQLQAIGSSVKIDQGDEYTFEHLDFNFQGEFKDANLRKAFALCVPRQQIVDNLIKPVNENATVLNSRYKLAFQEGYQQVVQASYAGQYDQPNIEQAKQLLGGKTGVTVRVGYQTPNQRRTDEVSLIKASCDQAGFNVEDAGQQDFFGNGLAAGNFDVALFAWSGSPLVSSSASTYVTGGGNNNGKYSNPQVDQLTATLLSQTDAAQQDQTIGQIEKVLWDDVATLPIFTFPGLQANSTEVTGPAFQPAQSQQTWNDNEWAVAQKS